MNIDDDKARAALARLPQGKLRLVDNRVLAGESTFAAQPATVCVCAPKHFGDENRQRLQALVDIANCVRDAAQEQDPQDPAGL
jgi:hypothetical protein